MSKLQELEVIGVKALTADSVALYFNPDPKDKTWHFESGQYLTVEADLPEGKIRRSYSICTSPELEKAGLLGRKRRIEPIGIGVKQVKNGIMSTYLCNEIKVGSKLGILPPEGKFTLPHPSPDWVAMVAAGSGITPILSHVKFLMKETSSKVVLCYGNRDWTSIMFLEELNALEKEYSSRLFVYHFLSNEAKQEKAPKVLFGRIKPSTAFKIVKKHAQGGSVEYFLCGPGDLMAEMQNQLVEVRGIEKSKVHLELFEAKSIPTDQNENDNGASVDARAEIILGGEHRTIEIPAGTRILDAVLAAGIDAPFSCQSGVCCTCQAKGQPGDFITDDCISITEEELAEGHVLTCVGLVKRPEVTIDYDQ